MALQGGLLRTIRGINIPGRLTLRETESELMKLLLVGGVPLPTVWPHFKNPDPVYQT